jgi:hypothetical protein
MKFIALHLYAASQNLVPCEHVLELFLFLNPGKTFSLSNTKLHETDFMAHSIRQMLCTLQGRSH